MSLSTVFFIKPPLRALRMIHIILATAIVQLICFSLSMPSDFSAVIAVFVLAQPQIGMLYSKAFNRLIGTVVGCLMAVLFVLLLGEHLVWFFIVLALWVAFCAWLSTVVWQPIAYLFQISGFTLSIVALPALLHHDSIFFSAMSRAFENGLSFLVMLVLAAILIPSLAQTELKQQVKSSMDAVLKLLQLSLTQSPTHADYIAQYDLSIQTTLALVVTRINASMESIKKIGILNTTNGFIQSQLSAITQINLFAHQRQKLALNDRNSELQLQLEEGLRTLSELETQSSVFLKYRQFLREQRYRLIHFSHQINHEALPTSITFRSHDIQPSLEASEKWHKSREEREKTVKRSQSVLLLTDCLDYLVLSASRLSIIMKGRYVNMAQQHPIAFHRFHRQAFIRAFRPFVAILVIASIWLFSGWHSGATMLFAPITYPLLFANVSDPKGLTIRQFQGLFYGIFFAFISRFILMPITPGEAYFFSALCVQLPALLLGSYLLTDVKSFGKGVNMLLSYYLLADIAPAFHQHSDLWDSFLNTALALILGNSVAFASLLFIFPENPLRCRQSIYHQVYAETAQLIKMNKQNPYEAEQFLSRVYDRLHHISEWYRGTLFFLPISRHLMQLLSLSQIFSEITFQDHLSEKTKKEYYFVLLKLTQWLTSCSRTEKVQPSHNLVFYFEQLNERIANEIVDDSHYRVQFMKFQLIPDLLRNSQICQDQIDLLEEK